MRSINTPAHTQLIEDFEEIAREEDHAHEDALAHFEVPGA